MSVLTNPTVLVSSTIYDLSDLRSALKYWLSELGYEVMLSEHNDFPKALDENSYESCLNAIKKADFFILLIGARTGGWFDEKKHVSITRMEYREALKSFQQTGRPKLAIFVRQNLWDIREDRTALRKYISEDHAKLRELDVVAKDKLINHPSKFANDVDAAFDFLHEIGQIEQMKAAICGSGDLPKANWIHLFSQFGDIAAALRVAFGVTTHVERKILSENLKQELLQNLCHIMRKSEKSKVIPISYLGTSILDKVTLRYEGSSLLESGDFTRLSLFLLYASSIPNQLSRLFVEQAVRSGIFMEFDPATGQYKATKSHHALLELLKLMDWLKI